MPMEEKRLKNDPLIDVGEKEGAEIELDNNEQTKVVAEEKKEEKIEVQQEEEKSVVEAKVEKPVAEKDELEEYSEGVKKRIAKLTRKMREAERQREEAIQFANSVKKEKEQIESRLSRTDQRYVSEFETRIGSSLANAKIALKSAIDNQDVEGQVNAQQQIAELTLEAARLKNLKAYQQEETAAKEKEVAITPQQTAQTAQVDPRAEDWASRNTWFGQDSAMTYTAFDLHKKLVEDEGIDPKSDEYYDEIDKRIRLEFPHKFATKETITTERAKPAQTVASANRPAQTGRKKTVKLTPSQVAIAKRLGVPLEEYAKHLTTKEV
jgi:hypothetical protein